MRTTPMITKAKATPTCSATKPANGAPIDTISVTHKESAESNVARKSFPACVRSPQPDKSAVFAHRRAWHSRHRVAQVKEAHQV